MMIFLLMIFHGIAIETKNSYNFSVFIILNIGPRYQQSNRIKKFFYTYSQCTKYIIEPVSISITWRKVCVHNKET